MDFENAQPDLSEFNNYRQRQAEQKYAKQSETDFAFADEEDPLLVESRKDVLSKMIQGAVAEDSEYELRPEYAEARPVDAEYEKISKAFRAQEVYNKIQRGENDLTREDFNVYDEHLGELRELHGGEMSVMNFLSGAYENFKEAFTSLGEGISEVHKDGEYGKIIPSLIEGGARDSRELYGSAWHSRNKNSWAYAVKQLLTGADTQDERWANFESAQRFARNTDKYLRGEEGLVFDPRYTNKNLVTAGETLADPATILGLMSGGTGFLASVARTAGGVGTSRALRSIAKAATVVNRASDYVMGVPLKAAGYPLWLAGAGAMKLTTGTIEVAGKVASRLTGGALEAASVSKALRTVGLGSAAFGADPLSRKFAAFYGLGFVSEGLGGAAVGVAQAAGRKGGLSVVEQLAQNSTIPTLSRRIGQVASKIDNIVPIPSLTVDALRGGMMGMSFNALLGGYADGMRGAYNSAQAGFGYGAFGGTIGGAFSKAANFSGRHVALMEYEAVMNEMDRTDTAQAQNIRTYVDRHDKLGIEVRHYVLGVANQLAGTSKILYLNQQQYEAFTGPAGSQTRGFFSKNVGNGVSLVAVNIDQVFSPTGNVAVDTGRGEASSTTNVHEMFHAIMWNNGYKRGMINRLTHHLLGLEIEGQRVIGTAVKPEEIESFFKVYAKKLAQKTDITQSEWYKKTMDGLAEYKRSGKIDEGLRDGIEEFGALFFEEWIKGKPMDYLFRGGDLGLTREAFHSIKESFGNAIRYGLKTMGHDLVSAGYNFSEVDAKINRGGVGAETLRAGMLNGTTIVRDPVMDRIMQDIVKGTWRPAANTTIDTLEGDGLRVWAEMTGNERRIYQDRRGVWKFKDVKQFRREEGIRGELLFKTLDELRAAGIDIGAEIVDENGVKRIEGHLNTEAIKALIDAGAITATEGRHIAAVQLAVERGADPKNKQPNGLRFEYHGLSEEVELADGTVVRNRRPWQNVDISDRRVIPYKYEFVLTTKDSNGNKIEPEFQEMVTAIDLDALDRRINANYNTPIRMRNGKVTTVGKLLSGRSGPNWAAIRGKVKTYLANLSRENARPSAMLFGGGVEGAAIRDALYMIVGTVPSQTSTFVNKPNRSLPQNKRGVDFVFTTFRKDLMFNIEETGSRLTFNEELAYPRAQSNYKPSDEMLQNDNVVKASLRIHTSKKPSMLGRDGKPLLAGKSEVKVASQFATADGTMVYETNKGIFLRSNLTREDIVFKAEKVFGDDGKAMVDEVGNFIMSDPWVEVNNYLNIQSQFNDAIARADISAGYGVVEFNGKYLVIEQSKTGAEKYIVSSKVFDNHEDAKDAARKIYKADSTYARILAEDTKLPVYNAKGNKVKVTPQHRNFAAKRLRELMIRNATNPESTPLDIAMENGVPVVIQTKDNKKGGAIVYKLKVKEAPYELLKNAGLTLDVKNTDHQTYANTTARYASKLVDDFRSQMNDPDIRNAIDWYKRVRREIRFLYGPASDMFFEMLGATSPNEGPEQNWKYAVEAMERYVKGDFDEQLEIAARKRDNLIKSVESGQFRTALETAQAYTNARKFFEKQVQSGIKNNKPFTYTEADVEAEAQKRLATLAEVKNTASRIATKELEKLGEFGKKKAAQIKKIISNNTYDTDRKVEQLIGVLLNKNGNAGMNLTKENLLEEAHKQLKLVAREFGDTITRPSTNKNRLGEMVKFGMHNEGIAQVMLGMYERMNFGPKTYNYQLNLKGAGERATIDLWAARSLRRIIMTENGEKQWRLLPVGESKVDDGDRFIYERSNYNGKDAVSPDGRRIESLVVYKDAIGDFYFAQDIFEEAVKQIRQEFPNDADLNLLQPHELQAIMWFREKKLWAKNRWTSGAGSSLSSYEQRALQAIGEEAPVDTEDFRAFKNVQRISISASVSTPTTSGGATGTIGDINSTIVSNEVKKRVLQTLGPSLKVGVFAPTAGVYAGNFTSQTGFYKGTEAALGLDWLVQGDTKRLDTAFMEALKLGIEIGMSGQQDTIAVHERVTAKHPNARDTYTVFFDRQYDADSPEVEALYTRMAQQGEFSGLTMEPSMQTINGKVRVVGFTFHHIPEFDIIYERAVINNESNVADVRRSFKSRMETVLGQFGWGAEGTLNADGSTRYTRGREVNISKTASVNGVDLSKMIADVNHGFINTVVVTHNEYSNADPVYLSRRNTNVLQNVRRIYNNNAQAKQKREAVRQQGEYARPREPLAQTSQTAQEQSGESGSPLAQGQEGGVSKAPAIQADGRLSNVENESQVDEYIEANKKVFDAKQIRNHTSLMTVGANDDYIISRGIVDGKPDSRVRVTHKTDSFPAYFKTEQDALAYVRERLAGTKGRMGNRQDTYDYYVRGTGIVAGVRRPAIDRLAGESESAYQERVRSTKGSDFDNYAEKMSGAVGGNDPLFMFFQQGNTDDASRGPFNAKVYGVENMPSVYGDLGDGDIIRFKPTDYGPEMNQAEFGKWRDAVAKNDLKAASAIVKSVLEAKGFNTDVPYYHGNAKPVVGEPRNWRAYGLSPRLYLGVSTNDVAGFSNMDVFERGVEEKDRATHTFALARDIKLFDATSKFDREKVLAVLRNTEWVQKAALQAIAQIDAFKKNNPLHEAKSDRIKNIHEHYDLYHNRLLGLIQNPKYAAIQFQIGYDNSKKAVTKQLDWTTFEDGVLAVAIKEAGFDGYYEAEMPTSPNRSLAIINPEKVKQMDAVTYGSVEDFNAGKPVDIAERGDRQRANVAYKPNDVTELEDATYAQLIRDGQLGRAKSMMENVRRRRGYSDDTYYHGTASEDPIRMFASRPNAGVAVHVTPSEPVARGFADAGMYSANPKARPDVYKLRVKKDNIFDPAKKEHTDKLLGKMVRLGIPVKTAKEAIKQVKTEGFYAYELSYNSNKGTVSLPLGRQQMVDYNFVQDAIQKLGFDGYYEREGGIDETIYINGKKVPATDETANPRNIAYHQSNFVKMEDVATYDDNGNLIPLSQRFDITNPDIRYKAGDEEVAPIRLSGRTKSIPTDENGRVIDVKSPEFKTDYIGVVANEEMPEVKDQFEIYFGKATSAKFNYLGRGGRAKISKDTYAVELTSGINKVGYLRFDIVPDRAKKGQLHMGNVVVNVSEEYRGNKLQHVLYSEAVERAKLLGARSFMQEIENEQGLPYKSQTKVLGEADSFVADMYSGRSYVANKEGWEAAKYPTYEIEKRKPDGSVEIETGKGENKYVFGYGNIHADRKYKPSEGGVRVKTYSNQESNKPKSNKFVTDGDIWERYI